jgi:ABC-type glutathione transport system ATPase component
MVPLLQLRDVSVSYVLDERTCVAAVEQVSFEVAAGEAVGLLGDSGCGKSTIAGAVMGLLPACARMRGSLRFRGRELLGLSEQQFRLIRGAEISLISQEPAAALNPVIRVGTQVSDVVRAHRPWNLNRCRLEARSVLRQVGLGSERLFQAYPHQLSGGQRQRVAIAQALACRPALLIADEPTTALDTTTQAEVLDLLRRLRRDFGMALILISHDPAVLAELTDRVIVMQAGRITEQGPTSVNYAQPRGAGSLA